MGLQNTDTLGIQLTHSSPEQYAPDAYSRGHLRRVCVCVRPLRIDIRIFSLDCLDTTRPSRRGLRSPLPSLDDGRPLQNGMQRRPVGCWPLQVGLGNVSPAHLHTCVFSFEELSRGLFWGFFPPPSLTLFFSSVEKNGKRRAGGLPSSVASAPAKAPHSAACQEWSGSPRLSDHRVCKREHSGETSQKERSGSVFRDPPFRKT